MLASLSLGWISRDAWLIMSARSLRTFAQSYMAVLIAIYLGRLGFGLAQIGAFLSVSVAGISFFSFAVSLIADRVGRRRLLVAFSVMSGAAGLSMFFVEDFLALLIVAFLGSLAVGGGGGGGSPAQPLEVASLPDTAPIEKRTDLFAIYGIIARSGTALGALAAGLPVIFQDAFSLNVIMSFKVMFVGFAVLQFGAALVYSFLSPAVEVTTSSQRWSNPFRLPSRRRIFTLNGLFGLDTFTTSMVTQSLIAYWFSSKFGIQLGSWPLFSSFPMYSLLLPSGWRRKLPIESACSTPWYLPTSPPAFS